jgi:V/A-type H+-transporting ATPase subunit F
MYKVGVVGEAESVAGFKAIGFETAEADDAASARRGIKELTDSGCAVIYITEAAYTPAPDIAAESRATAVPAIIVIPGAGGSLNLGLTELRAAAKRATGMDSLI